MNTKLPALIAATFACAVFVAPAASGQPQQASQDKPYYLALAISDAPIGRPRVIVATRGEKALDVVREAYLQCFRRVADGYMHTCRVGYGSGWVVGSECVAGVDSKQAPMLDIETDDASPQNAIGRSIAFTARISHTATALCRELAEYNANDLETARSVAIDEPKKPSSQASTARMPLAK